jgi:hypothetical protein
VRSIGRRKRERDSRSKGTRKGDGSVGEPLDERGKWGRDWEESDRRKGAERTERVKVDLANTVVDDRVASVSLVDLDLPLHER